MLRVLRAAAPLRRAAALATATAAGATYFCLPAQAEAPALAAQAGRITEVLRAEEERFFETLEIGMEILDAALAADTRTLPGDVAFKLHDTFGFPLDLTADVCRERGVAVDSAGFDAASSRNCASERRTPPPSFLITFVYSAASAAEEMYAPFASNIAIDAFQPA